MKIVEAIRERKSTRDFKPDPVPRDFLTEIINAGIAAPSKGNSQIWEFVVVTGNKKKDLDAMLLELLKTDFIPSMQLSDSDQEVSNEPLRKAKRRSSRNKEEISLILSSLGLSFEQFMLEGTFTFFSAPVAILVFLDDVFSKDLPHILSVGAAVENILLAAMDYDLGTCWIGGVWRYTKNIRALLGVPESKRLFSAVALGYADLDSPIVKYKSARDHITEFTRWIGLDEQE